MITFPCCKINIGLDILSRRDDNYHNIDTLICPLRGLTDSLEMVRCHARKTISITFSGIAIDAPVESNLVVRAWQLIFDRYHIGGVDVHLHKAVPFGAGLGGGSSDAAAALLMLDRLFELNLSKAQLSLLAATLGSDVPFFIDSVPSFCRSRGELTERSTIDPTSRYWTVLVLPDIAISTREAYRSVTPLVPAVALNKRLESPIEQWRELIVNAFEPSLFAVHPLLADYKQQLYDSGALYASLSGSGSALYGLFDSEPSLPPDTDRVRRLKFAPVKA